MTAINRVVDNVKTEKYWIDRLEALERLEGNEDYRMVFSDGYLTEHVLDGVKALQGGERAEVNEELVAISHCQEYLRTIKVNGISAKQDQVERFGEE